VATITISGTVYTDNGVTPMGAGRTINVSVGGAASAASATTASDGTFTTGSFTSNSGDVLTVYLQGNTEVGGTITKGTGSNLTGIDIYQNSMNLRSDNGVALTQGNINTGLSNGASGVTALYSAKSASVFTTVEGIQVYVPSGQSVTFAASGGGNTYKGSFVNRGTINLCAMTLAGVGGYILDTNSSAIRFLTVNPGSGKVYTLGSNLTVTSGTITLTSGILDVSASNYQIQNTGTWTVTSGTINARAGTVIIGGSNTGLNNLTFYNLSIANFTSATNLTATNNVTVIGAFNLNGKTINCGGNWAITTGTFTASSGTVNLNGSGTQTISGTSTFYNLTTSGGDRTIAWTDGTTQTISNSVIGGGTSGHLQTWTGTGTGGWTVAMPSTQALAYLNVSYSTATGNTGVATNSTDGGNNVNWTFGPTGSVGLIGPGLCGASPLISHGGPRGGLV